MKTFELQDEAGNTATVHILDDMPIEEAKEILVGNGVNDRGNFRERFKSEHYIFGGVHFTKNHGVYTVDYSNHNYSTMAVSKMKRFITEILTD